MIPEPIGQSPVRSAEPADVLMARIVQGDERAFEHLYDQLAPRVFGLVRKIVRDESLSEEVLQEVFLEAWRLAARFDPSRGGAAAWVMTLAHRRAVDRVRSSQSSRERDLKAGIRELNSSTPTMEEEAELLDEAVRARQALALLAEPQRQAIELAYFHGLTQVQVAQQLGIPLGTAKTRIRDGMSKLRNLMGDAR